MNRLRPVWTAFFLPITAFLTGYFSLDAGFLRAADGSPDVTIEVGRVLDADKVVAEGNPAFPDGPFTVAVRWLPMGKGTKEGNSGTVTGMILSWGSGYYDGFRVWQDFNGGGIHFELGGDNATRKGLGSTVTAVPGILHDLVGVYDGEKIRLYLDGKPAGETSGPEKLTPAKYGFQAGFNDHGIGSSKMEVTKVELWRRVLSTTEIAARFESHPADAKKLLGLVEKFAVVEGADNLDVSLETLDAVLSLPNFPENLRERALVMKTNRLTGESSRSAEALSEEIAEAKRLVDSAAQMTQENGVMTASRVADLVFRLESFPHSPEATEAIRSLETAFPKVAADLKKARELKERMIARVGKIGDQIAANRLAVMTRAQKIDEGNFGAKFRVAPDGIDRNNDGSKPFATLAAAIQAAVDADKPAVVEVADGTYYVEKPVEWTATKEKPSHPIYLRAAKNAKPVFTGMKILRGFKPVTDQAVLRRLNPDAAKKIVVVSLPENGVSDFGVLNVRGTVSETTPDWTDLYCHGEAMTLARWPNEGEPDLSTGEIVKGPKATDRFSDSGTFHYAEDRVDSWSAENDVWVDGKWRHLWASLKTPIVGRDQDAKTITIGVGDMARGMPYHFFNVLEELDRPGEYYIDRKAGLLYFYPPEGGEAPLPMSPSPLSSVDRSRWSRNVSFSEVGEAPLPMSPLPLSSVDRSRWSRNVSFSEGGEAPLPMSPSSLEKETVEFPVFAGPFFALRNVKDFVVEGLTFKGSRGDGFRVIDSESVFFQNCRFDQIGANGGIFGGGKFGGFFDSDMRGLGAGGIRLRGGDRKTLSPSGHAVLNSVVTDFCRIDRNYGPAIHISGCGMVARNNLFYDSPHHAFRVDGNDNDVSNNEVHSVVYEFDDQSGIDLWAEPTYRGNVINDNFWHHIGSGLDVAGQSGIRLDDAISGVVMIGNVFYRSAGGQFGGIQIHGGKDNVAAENLFVECKAAFSFSPWPDARYLDYVNQNHVKQWRADFAGPDFCAVYPFLDEIEENPNRNFIVRNRAVNGKTFLMRGGTKNVLAGNSFETRATSPTLDENGNPTPTGLRAWIESEFQKSLANVGLVKTPGRPEGRDSIQDRVTPHFHLQNASK